MQLPPVASSVYRLIIDIVDQDDLKVALNKIPLDEDDTDASFYTDRLEHDWWSPDGHALPSDYPAQDLKVVSANARKVRKVCLHRYNVSAR